MNHREPLDPTPLLNLIRRHCPQAEPIVDRASGSTWVTVLTTPTRDVEITLLKDGKVDVSDNGPETLPFTPADARFDDLDAATPMIVELLQRMTRGSEQRVA